MTRVFQELRRGKLAAELSLKFKMIVCGKYSASHHQNSIGASRNIINMVFLEEES